MWKFWNLGISLIYMLSVFSKASNLRKLGSLNANKKCSDSSSQQAKYRNFTTLIKLFKYLKTQKVLEWPYFETFSNNRFYISEFGQPRTNFMKHYLN
jgi:hypothetical protein